MTRWKCSLPLAALLVGVMPSGVAHAWQMTGEYRTYNQQLAGTTYEARFEKAVVEKGDWEGLSGYCVPMLKRTGLDKQLTVRQCIDAIGQVNGFTSDYDHDILAIGQEVWVFSPTQAQVASFNTVIGRSALQRVFGDNSEAVVAEIAEQLSIPQLRAEVGENRARLGQLADRVTDSFEALERAELERQALGARVDGVEAAARERTDATGTALKTVNRRLNATGEQIEAAAVAAASAQDSATSAQEAVGQLRDETAAKIEALQERVNELEARPSGTSTGANNGEELAELKAQLAALTSRMDGVASDVTSLGERMVNLEAEAKAAAEAAIANLDLSSVTTNEDGEVNVTELAARLVPLVRQQILASDEFKATQLSEDRATELATQVSTQVLDTALGPDGMIRKEFDTFEPKTTWWQLAAVIGSILALTLVVGIIVTAWRKGWFYADEKAEKAAGKTIDKAVEPDGKIGRAIDEKVKPVAEQATVAKDAAQAAAGKVAEMEERQGYRYSIRKIKDGPQKTLQPSDIKAKNVGNTFDYFIVVDDTVYCYTASVVSGDRGAARLVQVEGVFTGVAKVKPEQLHRKLCAHIEEHGPEKAGVRPGATAPEPEPA